MNNEMIDQMSCEEAELLISMACDDECSSKDIAKLKDHLRSCPACRELMNEYRGLRDVMLSRVVAYACPPPPQVAHKSKTIFGLPSKLVLNGLASLGGIAACIAFFLLGHYFGFANASGRISEYLSPIAVATPSMWVAKTPHTSFVISNIESEQPFTESIERYRSAIADELRSGEVDWMKVRDLVEAMGELRTDLELLTIHMAFLDIRTGKSPYDVAAHWENLGGNNFNRMVYKP